jgi:hypothetical protein
LREDKIVEDLRTEDNLANALDRSDMEALILKWKKWNSVGADEEMFVGKFSVTEFVRNIRDGDGIVRGREVIVRGSINHYTRVNLF